MEHKATKTERALCDVITSMDAQMKAKDDRIAELEAEVARLRDVVRKRTIEADDADYKAHTAWNDAIKASANVTIDRQTRDFILSLRR